MPPPASRASSISAVLAVGRPAARQHAEQQREEHHADAVVEQRLAGDHELELLRRARPT